MVSVVNFIFESTFTEKDNKVLKLLKDILDLPARVLEKLYIQYKKYRIKHKLYAPVAKKNKYADDVQLIVDDFLQWLE
jgi:hypothetical protein